MRALDLYSGIGGWTLGLEMAGIEVVRCYEWWDRAIETYNRNLPSVAKSQDIRALRPEDIDVEDIDIIVGSPPCTQFSYSNRGGNGDLADGLKDIAKFLEIVDHIRPKYWAMENVPRVRNILAKELGEGGQLEEYSDLVKVIEVVDVSEFGLPQRRKRMIAGDFPLQLLESYRATALQRTLGDVLKALHGRRTKDPIYGIKLPKRLLTEMENEPPLDREEARLNKDSKRFHPVYNKMPFPDPRDRAARTVTALCTRVSRESIVIEDPENPESLRRLSVRERASLQGFPINYQFFGRTHPEKIKMIGNAIPPLLTYLIAQSMRGLNAEELPAPETLIPQNLANLAHILATPPGGEGRTFPANRRFRAAIPNLRFGSGMRFELTNLIKNGEPEWRVDFYFGSSKEIRQVSLDAALAGELKDQDFWPSIECAYDTGVTRLDASLGAETPQAVQDSWTRRREGLGPHQIVDALGGWAEEIIEGLNTTDAGQLTAFVLDSTGHERNSEIKNGARKIAANSSAIAAGMIIGVWFNVIGPLRTPELVGGTVRSRAFA